MKKLIFRISALSLISLISCSDKIVDFNVSNYTDNVLDSVMISSSGTNYLQKSKVINFKKNTNSKISLDLSGVKKTDGNYYIEIYSKNLNIEKDFGYYSNGVPTDSNYNIEIMVDTLIIKERMNK